MLDFFYKNNLSMNLYYFLFLIIISFLLFLSVYVSFSTSNTIRSIIFLILIFLISSIYLLFFKLEYLAFIFVIIYVGAIAVFFLFIVMLIDIYKENNLGNKYSLNYFEIISLIFLFLIFFFLPYFYYKENYIYISCQNYSVLYFYNIFDSISYSYILNFEQNSINLFSYFLYDIYFYIFISAGLILLFAVFGGIVFLVDSCYENYNLKTKYSFLKKEKIISINDELEYLHLLNFYNNKV